MKINWFNFDFDFRDLVLNLNFYVVKCLNDIQLLFIQQFLVI